MSITSFLLHISLKPCKKDLLAGWIPDSPCIGSTIIAAVLLDITFLTDFRSLKLACKINSGSGPKPSLKVSEPPKAMFSRDLP